MVAGESRNGMSMLQCTLSLKSLKAFACVILRLERLDVAEEAVQCLMSLIGTWPGCGCGEAGQIRIMRRDSP